MQPLLFDEGLPRVAAGLAELGLSANAVGHPGAPPTQSPDERNCEWCKAHGAVLVTHDRGKTSREIVHVLAKHGVGAIFVHKDLRAAPPHNLARALLIAESQIDQLAVGRGRLYHRLTRSGRLEKRK